jgi:acylglycerol kinase
MAIIEGNTVWKDAMKIEPITKDDEEPSRPIYALSSIEWGAFRDTLAKKDKYWFCGSWREYAAFIFNGYKESITWNCSGVIKYSPPCAGCSNCVEKKPEVKRKWLFFVPNANAVTQHDHTKLLNPECATSQELCFKTCDFKINTNSNDEQIGLPALNISLGQNTYTYTGFVSEGWRRLKQNYPHTQTIPVRTVELIPNEEKKEVMIEIDKEEFESKPVKITLLPKIVKLFCKSE